MKPTTKFYGVSESRMKEFDDFVGKLEGVEISALYGACGKRWEQLGSDAYDACKIGDRVEFFYSATGKWVAGIIERKGPKYATIRFEDGRGIRTNWANVRKVTK